MATYIFIHIIIMSILKSSYIGDDIYSSFRSACVTSLAYCRALRLLASMRRRYIMPFSYFYYEPLICVIIHLITILNAIAWCLERARPQLKTHGCKVANDTRHYLEALMPLRQAWLLFPLRAFHGFKICMDIFVIYITSRPLPASCDAPLLIVLQVV